jgi:plasmid stabilization system protein ParE
MKKKKPSTQSNGLVIRKFSYSYTITPLGEPSARVTIHHGDIEGLEYDTDWKSHSLVTLHGCTLEGAKLAVRSAFVARMKMTASTIFEKPHLVFQEYVVQRFLEQDGRSLSQRFREITEDIEELEGAGGWKPTIKQFVTKLANAARKPKRGKSRPELADEWLIDNWVSGEVACLLNNRQISKKLEEARIKYGSKKVDEKIRVLALKKPKRPVKEKGYKAHFS